MAMDIYKLLKADHKKVSGLFEEIEATTNRAIKTRQELFSKINTELSAHSTVEEQLLYPRLEQPEPTHSMTLESYEEHGVVKQLLSELEAMSVDTDEFMAKLTVLRENVEHHVKEEENDLFPKAKKVLSDEEAEDLADRAEAMKKDMGL